MIPLNTIELNKDSLSNAVNSIIKNEISGNYGEYISKFENRVSKYCGRTYGISTCNGTSALHLSLMSLGISKNDEVIVPNVTMAATVFAIKYIGAKPIPVDIDYDTWNINPDLIEEKITDNTKAIIPVHLYGNPCEMDEIIKISNNNNLEIIEDCAEALGSTYHHKPIGSFGIASCLSFYATKMVSCGEGGMILTDNKCISDYANNLKNMAFGEEERYTHSRIGYNYRLSNILAAIGFGQMNKLESIIDGKRRIYDLYNRYIPFEYQKETPYSLNCRWMIGARLDDRDTIKNKLNSKNIQTGDVFTPLNLLDFIETNEDYPISEDLYKRGLLFPSGYDLKYKDIHRILSVIEE